jgi:hypothetical protein
MMKRFAVPAALLFLLFVAGSFLYVQFTDALTKTLCCADDAYYSLVAKNLVFNGSYGRPLSSETVSLFDPTIGSGPGLILPGAAMIALVGAQPWATSLTTVLLFAAALTLMTILLATRFPLANVCLYTALSLLALVAITPFQQFAFVFVGEAPAFGYLMVGCALLVTSRGRASWVLVSALCISLALLTKHIALCCAFGGSGVWFLRELYLNRSRDWRKDDPILGLMLFAGAIVHLLYIIFISNLWARYFWIGMAMMGFAAMSPILYVGLRFALPIAVAAVAFVATPNAVLLTYRIQLSEIDGRLARERDTVLREIAKHPDLPIVSQDWASIYDTIYLLNDNHPWYMTNDEHMVPTLRALFVMFDQFAGKTYPLYSLVHRLCERVHPELKFYKVFICTGSASQTK